MQKRISEFTEERFYGHIENLIDIGMESSRYKDMFDTLYFLTDLKDFVEEVKEKMNKNEKFLS